MRYTWTILAISLLILTSCKPDSLNEAMLDEIGLSNDDLRPFLDRFVEIGTENGHDYTYVYNQPITMEFTNDFKFGHNGQSWGINDKNIEIYINAKFFKRQKDQFDRTGEWPQFAQYVIYHELAHDILNLKHKHNTALMSTESDIDPTDPLSVEKLVIEAMKYAKDTGKNSNKSANNDEPEYIECSIG